VRVGRPVVGTDDSLSGFNVDHADVNTEYVKNDTTHKNKSASKWNKYKAIINANRRKKYKLDPEFEKSHSYKIYHCNPSPIIRHALNSYRVHPSPVKRRALQSYYAHPSPVKRKALISYYKDHEGVKKDPEKNIVC